ncbi:SpoIIE family protein phosphatase [Streptomyces sp. NPDC050856]|uniref:PP2C family protein-serine/threonine phosphatase n=1 Tax=Streptomyces sp. NPDC050856 TaxID=3154939 RepID=UPI0033C4406D
MPSHLFADRSAPQPPERGTVDALISQTRRLRGDLDAVRRDAVADEDDPQGRWQRALCELAAHQLDDVRAQLGQLKEGPPDLLAPEAEPGPAEAHVSPPDAGAGSEERPAGSLLSRVGSAEWNLLTDEVNWSEELYRILGRSPGTGPMSLDELPSMVFAEDQALLTTMVTGCLIDGKPIDGEFRIVRGDGRVRTLHMMGEPVLDADGCTASMWAVLRDVSELRRSERAVRESRDSLQRRRHLEQTEHRVVVELQEAVLPAWQGPLRLPRRGTAALDVAVHCLRSRGTALMGGNWYDAMELPGGDALLTVGELTGHGLSATSAMALLLGALRGMAVAGIEPGALLGHLNQVLESSAQAALGSAVCCRYSPASGTLRWAQAGHPAPLLLRGGTGCALTRPDGVLLGATSGAAYEQAQVRLLPGDVLMLHTDGPAGDPGTGNSRADRLLGLAPRVAGAHGARECVRSVVEEFGVPSHEDDACVVVARVGDER